jgi:hypothetical protein
MRYLLALLLVAISLSAVTFVQWEHGEELDPYTYEYITRNFNSDTESKNGVAAVLLNYRVYDTMFEALILLTAIIGMTQFLPRRSDVEGGDGGSAGTGDGEVGGVDGRRADGGNGGGSAKASNVRGIPIDE